MRKSFKSIIFSFILFSFVIINLDVIEASSYTYTVSFFSGNPGSFTNLSSFQVRKAVGNEQEVSISHLGHKVVISGLEYGDTVSCNAQDSISLDADSKYYVKGIRLSGRDNNTVASSAFTVVEDQDYVIAYGIPGEMTEYTVEYVDEAGNTLAPSRIYSGNVGDEPVIAYLYIDGYTPASYNQTSKLVSDSNSNIFRFVYSRGQSITDNGGNNVTPGAGAGVDGNAVTPGAGVGADGNAVTPGAGAGVDGNAVTPGAGVGADGTAVTPGAGAGVDGNANNPVIIPDGNNPPAAGGGTPPATVNNSNQTIVDPETPRSSNPLIHIIDTITPLADNLSRSGLWLPIVVGVVAVSGVAVSGVFIIRKRRSAFIKAGDSEK